MTAVARDPAIKLFGRTICLPETEFSDGSESLDNGSSSMAKTETEECRNEAISFEQPQITIEQPLASIATLKPKDDPEESDCTKEQKQMKRPDKILPCPRCSSSDTKFCYFNNYNVNQPRHFCKSCQRYWTAGGTVRNVPVGAGRRRNKHLVSHYSQVTASSDTGPTMVGEAPDSATNQLTGEESCSSCTGSSPNHEMVLKFGPESPHCDNPCASLTASGFGVRPINSIDVSSQHQLYQYVAPQISAPNGSHSNGSMSLAVPRIGTPNISYQIVPAAYMNCIPAWVNESGNISLAVSNGSHFQVLGEHSRDFKGAHEGRTEDSMTVPKTLRFHELDEA